MNEVKFYTGQVVGTPGALKAIQDAGDSMQKYLVRHQSGDWGDLDEEDKKMNDEGLKPLCEDRLLSAYVLSTGVKIWIITEWDRSATTILLPSEY